MTMLCAPLPALQAPAYAVVAANPALGWICLWTTSTRRFSLLLRFRSHARARICPKLALLPLPPPHRPLSLLLHPAPEHRVSSLILGANAPILPIALFLATARRTCAWN
jgi:hypothetical protein